MYLLSLLRFSIVGYNVGPVSIPPTDTTAALPVAARAPIRTVAAQRTEIRPVRRVRIEAHHTGIAGAAEVVEVAGIRSATLVGIVRSEAARRWAQETSAVVALHVVSRIEVHLSLRHRDGSVHAHRGAGRHSHGWHILRRHLHL